jgi:hypothetical protein
VCALQRTAVVEVDNIQFPSCLAPSCWTWCLSSSIERLQAPQPPDEGFLKELLAQLAALQSRMQEDVFRHLIVRTDPVYLYASIAIRR